VQPEIPLESFEIFASGLDHPECVAFDSQGVLWAGGEAGQVYRITPDGSMNTVAELGGFCAGVAISPGAEDAFVCCSGKGVMRVPRSGRSELFATRAGSHSIVSPNFGLFDSTGRYFVTDSGRWKQRNGFLLCFQPDGSGEVIAGPFGYANGLALSDDETSLYMVESDTQRVLRFRIAAQGAVTEPEVFASEIVRFPDGLAFDEAGDLYVSCYASDDIHRITAAGAKSLFAWDPWGILLGRPTNMAFWDQHIYVANLGRQTITRARVGRRGQLLAHQKRSRESLPA